MSWTMSITKTDGSVLTVAIRSPQFGDYCDQRRRQDFGETEDGTRFVQDLGRTYETISGSWQNLDKCEVRDLKAFFAEDAALMGARKFKLTVYETAAMGGQIALIPVDAEFYRAMVKLDQRNLRFTTQQDRHYSASLRFKVFDLEPVAFSDGIATSDSASVVKDNIVVDLADSVSLTEGVNAGGNLDVTRSDSVSVTDLAAALKSSIDRARSDSVAVSDSVAILSTRHGQLHFNKPLQSGHIATLGL